MKYKKTTIAIMIAITSVLMIVMASAANTQIISTLSFGSMDIGGAEEANAFNMATDGARISVDSQQASQVIFTNQEGQEGYYYKLGDNIESLEVENYLSFTINRQLSAVALISSLSTLADNQIFSQSQVDKVQALFDEMESSSESLYFLEPENADMMQIDDENIQAVLLPDDGKGAVLIDTGLNFESAELPLEIKFLAEEGASQQEVSEEVVGATGEEAEAADGEIGCIDGDGGENGYMTPSYVSHISEEDGQLIQKVRTDKCAVEEISEGEYRRTLFEWKCENDNPVFEEIMCSEEFGANYECRNGACVEKDGDEPERYCVDIDPLVNAVTLQAYLDTFGRKGASYGFYASRGEYEQEFEGKEFDVWGDYCSNDKELIEYYCSAESVVFRSVTCPNGCLNGKCPEPPYCYETDGGNQSLYKGTLKHVDEDGTIDSAEDVCNIDGTLREYFCDPDNTDTGFSYEHISCEEMGMTCSEGKCIEPDAVDAECYSDDDCVNFGVCMDNICVAECSSDEECAEGEVCDTATQKCVAELKTCRKCDENNPFNIREWEAYSCNTQSFNTNVGPIDVITGNVAGIGDLDMPIFVPTDEEQEEAEEDCGEEGETSSRPDFECCEGLKMVYPGPMISLKACVNCGDGICGEYEDEDNCAIDCTEESLATEESWRLLRCPEGTYCSEGSCIEEPLSTEQDQLEALQRRKTWAEFLDSALTFMFGEEGWGSIGGTSIPGTIESEYRRAQITAYLKADIQYAMYDLGNLS